MNISLKQLICNLIIVLSLLSVSRVFTQNNPLPLKSIYSPFKPDRIKQKVKMNEEGNWVGYLVNHQLILHSVSTSKKIPIAKQINDWAWLNSHQLLLYKQVEKTSELSIIDTSGTLFKKVQINASNQFRLLDVAENGSNNFIAVINFITKEKDGIYQFNIPQLTYHKKYELEDFHHWYFDAKLSLIAASKQVGLYHYEPWLKTSTSWKRIEEAQVPIKSIGLNMGGIVNVSKDGKQIYFMNNYSNDKIELKQYDINTQTINTLFRSPKHDLIWADAHIDAKNGVPLSVTSYSSTYISHLLDSASKKDYQYIKQVGKGTPQVFQENKNGNKWLVRFLRGAKIDYYQYSTESPNLQFLFSSDEAMNDYPLSTIQTLTTQGKDGLQLEHQLIFSTHFDQDSDAWPDYPLPTIVFIHGGPWMGFNQWDPFYQLLFEFWASRGYLVINAQYRSGIGFGRKYVEAGKKEWGGKIISDIMSTIDTCIYLKVADSKRIAAWGWSFGGYASMQLLASHSNQFACGFAMYGLSDLYQFMVEKMPIFTKNGKKEWWIANLGDPDHQEDSIQLKHFSPFYNIESINKPLLLTHGKKDKRAPIGQSDKIAEVLWNKQKQVTYFRFPNENHDFREEASWQYTLYVAEHFFNQHLKGQIDTTQTTPLNSKHEWVCGKKYILNLK